MSHKRRTHFVRSSPSLANLPQGVTWCRAPRGCSSLKMVAGLSVSQKPFGDCRRLTSNRRQSGANQSFPFWHPHVSVQSTCSPPPQVLGSPGRSRPSHSPDPAESAPWPRPGSSMEETGQRPIGRACHETEGPNHATLGALNSTNPPSPCSSTANEVMWLRGSSRDT